MKKLLSALLIATLLIASVACVFAVAEEGDTTKIAPDELIATYNLNTGAKYDSKFHTVLAKIGDNKTIEQITGYLLDGAGKDYNYFFVYAVVADADGNYVVTDVQTALGRPAGVKSNVEVPENGYLVCINATEIEDQAEAVSVGDIAVFEGFELATLADLKPTENPIADTAKVSFYTAKEVEDTTTDGGDDTTSTEDDTTTDGEDDTTTDGEDDTTTDGEDDTTTDGEDDTTTSEAPAASSEAPAASSEAPSTGDAGMIVFAVLAVVALAGGFIVVRARG